MLVCYNLCSWQVNNNLTITPEKHTKQGISGKKGANNNYDKSTIHLPRQQVAFWEECRKIKGCGSLKEDFYTRFMTGNVDLGLWHGLLKMVKYDLVNRTWLIFVFFDGVLFCLKEKLKEHNEYYFKVNWSLFEVTLK